MTLAISRLPVGKVQSRLFPNVAGLQFFMIMCDYYMHYDIKPIIIYLFVFFYFFETLKIFLYISVSVSFHPMFM